MTPPDLPSRTDGQPALDLEPIRQRSEAPMSDSLRDRLTAAMWKGTRSDLADLRTDAALVAVAEWLHAQADQLRAARSADRTRADGGDRDYSRTLTDQIYILASVADSIAPAAQTAIRSGESTDE